MIKRNLRRRIFASLIDTLLFFGLLYSYILFFGEKSNGIHQVTGMSVLPIILIWFVYFPIVEGTQGGTLGHLLLDLQVVKLNRERLGIGTAFIRHIVDPLDVYCWGLVAFISIYASEKHQRLGDMLAQTIVINTKDKEQLEFVESKFMN